MNSLLDSFVTIDLNRAAFSILKLGKRIVGVVETFDQEASRKIVIFSLVKMPLREHIRNGSLEKIQDLSRWHRALVICEEMLLDKVASTSVIQTILDDIEGLKDYSKIDWTSSYEVSLEKLSGVWDYIEKSKEKELFYKSINYQENAIYPNCFDNDSWFSDLLKHSDLEFSVPSDNDDPKFLNTSHFFSSPHDKELLLAAYDGDVRKLKTAIQKGADVNTKLNRSFIGSIIGDGMNYYPGFTALMFSVCRRDYEMVKFLLECKANTDILVKINGECFSAMDFAIFLKLPINFLELFYNLDSKHGFDFKDYYNTDYRLVHYYSLREFMRYPYFCELNDQINGRHINAEPKETNIDDFIDDFEETSSENAIEFFEEGITNQGTLDKFEEKLSFPQVKPRTKSEENPPPYTDTLFYNNNNEVKRNSLDDKRRHSFS